MFIESAVLRHYDMTTMIKVPAHEFLFGYDDKFISTVKGFSRFINKDLPFEKFGILAMVWQ
jgi:hypothetical protein